MKKIKIYFILFPLLTIFFWVIIVATFIAAAAEDDGTNGNHYIGNILAQLFYFFRFPTHTIFWEFMINGRMFLFFLGLMFNGLFYALLTERVISFIANNQSNK